MPRNLTARTDIEADALRQRRDLYAIAIALMIFHLAGGELQKEATITAVLPVQLERPWVLEAAAWLGFFYFWFRFWLVSEAKPLADLYEDAQWQAGNLMDMRNLAVRMVNARGDVSEQEASALAQIRRRDGPVPIPGFEGGKAIFRLSGIFNRGPHGRVRHPAGVSVGLHGDHRFVPPGERLGFVRKMLIGGLLAIYKERTFSDYTLPHLFAIATLLVGAWAHLAR